MTRIDAILATLASVPTESPEPGELPSDLPAEELARSPAARLVGRAAAKDGLVLAHYEHRAPMDPDPADLPWDQGVVPEPKYADFRHDLPIGSFHPGHRAKWTAHELAHLQIGFAWWPGASPFAIATASRLAELWPVVQWYFFDEVGLRRCDRHDGPLFRTLCPDCEAVARQGARPVDPDRDRDFVVEGLAFVERELAAVARTRRTGTPVAHVWGSLDLCSDGLAYAASHAPRLDGWAFRTWAERFYGPATGGFGDLDALIARIESMIDAFAEGGDLPTWFSGPVEGRRRICAMDLGARLLDAAELGPDALRPEIVALVDALAEGAAPEVVAGQYAELEGAFAPDRVWAPGYRWAEGPDAHGVGLARLDAGLRSATPVTLELFDDAGLDPVGDFAHADPRVRRPLAERFADWLADAHPGSVAALARYEAAIRHVMADPLAALGPDGEGLGCAQGVVVIRAGFDVVAFAEAVDAGEVVVSVTDGVLSAPPLPGEADELADALIVARDPGGALVLALVPDDLAVAMLDAPETLSDDDRDELLDLGVLRRQRWNLEKAPSS